MAPVNQLGVLAFASAVLAVPHAQWQPFKRHAHAHPAAPPAYESSYVPVYGGSSSSVVEPASESAPAYPSGSASAPAYPSASESSFGPASVSGSWSVPAYPSASESSAEPLSGSGSWSVPAYPSASGSSVNPVSGSGSAPPYPIPSGSSAGAFSTGGYGYPSSSYVTGYSSAGAYPSGYPSGAVPSYSTCTETSTLIYKSTTSYSTFYVTHTIYESPASSVAPASEGPGYSAPAGGAPGYSAPAGGEGASCVPDVTVTETVKTTVYVTPGGPAPSSAAPVASSYGGGYGAPSSVGATPSSEAAPSYPAGTPSSASAAAPSYSAPSSGGATGKRGLAYNDASLANTFAGSNAAGWGYNWLSDSSGLDSSIPYIPMLWGPSDDFTGTWQANAQKGIADGAQYLFSFNEPDMSSQSNLSPEAAAAAWKQYMEPFAGQAKLVAPSVTNGQGNGIGLSWLTEFLSACSDCTIDAVAMHWYYAGNPIDTFKDQITQVATSTGKGIWLNEFGATGSDEDKSNFLTEVLPWLESNDSILGYSYFMVSDGLLMLGDSLSSYGQVYADS